MSVEPTRLRQVTLWEAASRSDEIKTDIHLVGGWEDHNFLGGLRDFNVTFKPGRRPLPVRINNLRGPVKPLPEERLKIELRQPGFIEARTTGSSARVQRLPAARGGEPARPAGRRLPRAEAARRRGAHVLEEALRRPRLHLPGREPFAYSRPRPGAENVFLSFPELVTHLDFRDNAVRPHSGIYLGNTFQVAGGIFGGTATDVRVQPEVRTYLPMAHGLTFATRASVGFLWSSNYGKNWNGELENSAASPRAPGRRRQAARSSCTTSRSCTSAVSSPADRRPTAGFRFSGSLRTGSFRF